MDGRQVTKDRVTMNDERVRWDCGSARPVGEAQPPTFFLLWSWPVRYACSAARRCARTEEGRHRWTPPSVLLPPFKNIRCFNFLKLMYLDIF
jgi:hypothetical protein